MNLLSIIKAVWSDQVGKALIKFLLILLVISISWLLLGYDNPIEEFTEKKVKDDMGIEFDASPQNNTDPDFKY